MSWETQEYQTVDAFTLAVPNPVVQVYGLENVCARWLSVGSTRRVRRLRTFICVTVGSQREVTSRKAGMKLCLSAKITPTLCVKA